MRKLTIIGMMMIAFSASAGGDAGNGLSGDSTGNGRYGLLPGGGSDSSGLFSKERSGLLGREGNGFFGHGKEG